jgi:hypothetical protein
MLNNNTLYDLLAHPFWEEVMFIENNNWVQYISQTPAQTKQSFLNCVLEGFYPLTALSPVIYQRVSALTEGKTKALSQQIYQTELGQHPLLKNSVYLNITHARQFKELIESLMPDLSLPTPSQLSYQYTQENNLQHASLTQAIAMAAIVEYNAPKIIHGLEEFVAQWQTHCKIPSAQIKRNFMLEHGLLEGNDCEEQHIAMIEEILADNKAEINEAEFKKELISFKLRYHRLLENVYNKITALYFLKQAA